MVCGTIPYDSAQVKMDSIRFSSSVWLLVKVTLVSIASDVKNHSFAIF